MLTPSELRDQIAEIRRRTSAPFNVNFFCHVSPKLDADRQTRWLEELAQDYAEAALDPPADGGEPARAPFESATAEIIEEAKPPVVSFHLAYRTGRCRGQAYQRGGRPGASRSAR